MQNSPEPDQCNLNSCSSCSTLSQLSVDLQIVRQIIAEGGPIASPAAADDKQAGGSGGAAEAPASAESVLQWLLSVALALADAPAPLQVLREEDDRGGLGSRVGRGAEAFACTRRCGGRAHHDARRAHIP